MKRGMRGKTYNIGGRGEMRNIDVVNMICDRMDTMVPLQDGRSRRELIRFVKDRPGHDLRYAMDFSRLQKELDWEPQESFASGIQKTIEWYIANSAWVQSVKSGEYRKWMEEHYRQS
jgi:dTDP-glucose 4,6-dehydratase